MGVGRERGTVSANVERTTISSQKPYLDGSRWEATATHVVKRLRQLGAAIRLEGLSGKVCAELGWDTVVPAQRYDLDPRGLGL